MKNVKNFLLLVALLATTIGFSFCDKTDDVPVQVTPAPTLSEAEINMLQFMREEEKLARDVYQHFYEKFGLNIFKNIKSSEQTHTDAVLTVMNQYHVPDIAATEPGVFNIPELQTLYNALIAQGDVSVTAALTVGATVEDVDIRDLREGISGTTNTDIVNMYQRLECASNNHLRSFTGNLSNYGVTYAPQFISQALYEEIINGAHENCGQ